jgi:mannose-6-phosphate isomerase-like protein (cupin superfamily)
MLHHPAHGVRDGTKEAAVASVESKSFDNPDETRPFADHGHAKVVTIGGGTVIKGTFEPGWRWSEHLKPIAGTESCQSPHLLYVISGRMAVRMDDGTEGEVGPNDVARIEPGHDAWVIGDEACVTVDFGPSPAYAKPNP